MTYSDGDRCPNPKCKGTLRLNIHKQTDKYDVLTCYTCHANQIAYKEKDE